jgi:proteasome activator subunit 4
MTQRKQCVTFLSYLLADIDAVYSQLCTTAFFVEVAQYIKFGDLTVDEEEQTTVTDTEGPHTLFKPNGIEIPQVVFIESPDGYDSGEEAKLSKKDEDTLLKESTAEFSDWITNFIRRVILLLENLPDENAEGSHAGGESEGKCSSCTYRAIKLTKRPSSSGRCRHRCLLADLHTPFGLPL